MNNFDSIQSVMFIVIPILSGLIFLFTILMMFSSKFRGKMMSKQVNAMKHMTNFSKVDMEEMMTNMINTKNNVINKNEETLRNIANKTADINKDAVKSTASAVKEGFSNEATVFCKHCGAVIDADSKFCKSCGKEQ